MSALFFGGRLNALLQLHYLQNLSAHPFLSLDIDPVQDQMAIGSADGKVHINW